ncbi:ferredoxin [Streptomyces sp. NPDC048606]|uniref:ferredoxin n=1 Tax=Streptomyces sp. NPDC048606 TaxID=3154726 RepID=UPI0034450FDE
MTEMYWDPTPHIRSSSGVSVEYGSGVFELPSPESYLFGSWENRDWRNVPGPFYGAETDTCMMGREIAPLNILYGDEMDEFVFRQPRNPLEVHKVLFAALNDPYGAYASDGDQYWTVAGVRDWWRSRERVREWIHSASCGLAHRKNPTDHDLVSGLRDYLEYIDGDLERDLRVYMFHLDNGEAPEVDVILPDLWHSSRRS